MNNNILAIAGSFLVAALMLPSFLTRDIADEPAEKLPVKSQAQPVRQAPKQVRHNPLNGRKIIIDADHRGQFSAEIKINGLRTKALVDTGATYVAINQSTARRAGLRLKNSDFKYEVQTANGKAKVAAGKLKQVKIGRIVVDNVDVVISKDGALGTALLGMSFLGKLKNFQIKGDQLILQQ